MVKWLRMMGYDTLAFNSGSDSAMVGAALREDRVILTRDTQIMKRRAVTSGKLKAVLITSDRPEIQACQVIEELNLDRDFSPFTVCLECNQILGPSSKAQVEGRVPPYVYQTQDQYMECPACHRIYWRGTHWQAMTRKIKRLSECKEKEE
jgi:uncharacterized protein with PIN domain